MNERIHPGRASAVQGRRERTSLGGFFFPPTNVCAPTIRSCTRSTAGKDAPAHQHTHDIRKYNRGNTALLVLADPKAQHQKISRYCENPKTHP